MNIIPKQITILGFTYDICLLDEIEDIGYIIDGDTIYGG